MPFVPSVSHQLGDLDNQSNDSRSSSVGPRSAAQKIAQQIDELQIVPTSTRKMFLKPALWARPIRPKAWLARTVNDAIKSLPKKVIAELSRLPEITQELAAQHNTTINQLKADYRQFAATHATYHLVHALNAAIDKDWAPAAGEAANPQLNKMAQQLILNKLETLLQPEQLQQAIRNVPNFIQVEAENTVGQKEYFAFHELMDSLVLNSLQTLLPTPFGIHARPPSAKQLNQAFESLSGSELRQRYLGVCEAMLSGLSGFAQAYDGFVTQAGMELQGSKTQQLLNAVRDKEGKHEPLVQQFITKRRASFTQALNTALEGLSPEVKQAFLWVVVVPHLQSPNSRATSLARNLPAIQTAIHKLEDLRQPKVSKLRQPTNPWAPEHKASLVKAAVQDTKKTIENLGLSEARQAYASNRSGYATKDSGVYKHIEKAAGPLMLYGLAPTHRKHVLNALAEYGEAVTQFFKNRELQIRSGKSGVGLKDKPQRSFAQVYKNYKTSNVNHQTVHFTATRQAEKLSTQAVLKQMVSYEQDSLAAPHFSASKNHVLLSPLFSSKGETTVVHELGHAMDRHTRPFFSLSVFGSSANKALRQEYEQIQQDKTGLTAYGQSHVHEYLAESFPALLNQHGAGSSYMPWDDQNDLYSAENLQARHPVAYQYLKELLRNPEKPQRARAILKGLKADTSS